MLLVEYYISAVCLSKIMLRHCLKFIFSFRTLEITFRTLTKKMTKLAL
jgi:hypothetical protein